MAHAQKSEGVGGAESGVYSNSHDERDVLSESSGSSHGSVLTNPVNLSLVQLVNRLPTDVRKLSWEIQNKLAKHLNQLKDPVSNDWRLVASRLGFSRTDVDVFAKSDDPTMQMLGLCNTTTTEKLFRIIQDIGRSDVIEDLLAYLAHLESPRHCLPTQESLEDDAQSSLSQPFEESSSDISKLSINSRQPSEQEDDQEQIPCSTSENFWKGIPGSHDKKKWRDFWTASLKACKTESEHGGIDKFLCHIFKINYDEREDGHVRLDYFIRLLNFFGPYKPGEDGCLKKMYDLIIKSVSKSENGKKQSWFAGYMNKEEAKKRLADETPGKFLVRFSGSKVEEGWFVLAVKTREDVEQYEIVKDTTNNQLLIAEERFPDLVSVVERLHHYTLISQCRQLLINPCPDLPLNDNFTGYIKATRHRGRGRGRGRPR